MADQDDQERDVDSRDIDDAARLETFTIIAVNHLPLAILDVKAKLAKTEAFDFEVENYWTDDKEGNIYIFQCWFSLNHDNPDWLIPSMMTELAPTLVNTPPTGCSCSLSSRSRLASTSLKNWIKLSSSVKSLYFSVRSP